MRILRVLPALLAAAFLLGSCSPLATRREPTTIQVSGATVARDLVDFIADSDVIAIGIVEDVAPSRWSTENGRLPPGTAAESVPMNATIFTDSTFNVARVLKGEVETSRLRIRTFGGTVGDVTLTVEGDEAPRAGQEYLLFLVDDTGSTATIGPTHYLALGGAYDRFEIHQGKAISGSDEWALEVITACIDETLAETGTCGAVRYLERRFKELGIPVLNVEVTHPNHLAPPDDPMSVQVTYRLAGSETRRTPVDQVNLHVITREIELARLHGYSIGSYGVEVVDAEGRHVTGMLARTKQDEHMWLDDYPSRFTDAATADMIRERLDLRGLSLTSLEVSSSEGLQSVHMKLTTDDVPTASQAGGSVVFSMGPLVNGLNEEGAHVVSVWVELNDEAGTPLLNYMRDLRVGDEGLWTADNMNVDFGPRPAPPQP